MTRFKLIIEYDGSPYHGWQFQKNKPTVMGVLMNACKSALGVSEFELYGAGRTDAGVHALAQVAHLDVRTRLQPDVLRLRLNDALPATVNILSIATADASFHARYDAVARSYVYHIAQRRTAFAKKYAYWVKDALDIEAMKRGCGVFEGMHDFKSFGSVLDEKQSTRVQIYHAAVQQKSASILIHIVGSHFLWKMVRRVVGVLIACGRDTVDAEDIRRLLKTDSTVPAELTAPPSGLFLERVYYGSLPTEFQPLWPMVISK
ncbi:MAG: tRNA pseudouridine(38-40) synthase TruA [Thermodesulfobacteriota bacterium]